MGSGSPLLCRFGPGLACRLCVQRDSFQPFNGSSQFTGTFTYATDLPLYPGVTPTPGWSYYSGVPINPTEPVTSLTFNVGGLSSTSFGSLASDEVIVTHTTQGYDGFYINESF